MIAAQTDAFYASATVFDVFPLPLAAGDPATALQEPNSIVIDRRMAGRCFLGREALKFSNQHLRAIGDEHRSGWLIEIRLELDSVETRHVIMCFKILNRIVLPARMLYSVLIGRVRTGGGVAPVVFGNKLLYGPFFHRK